MKMGRKERISFMKDKKEYRYFIEANPQSNTVNIYDENFKQINLTKALGSKTFEDFKLVNRMKEDQKEENTIYQGKKISQSL